jgi:hypothetical protein
VTTHFIFHLIVFLGGCSFVGPAGSSVLTGGNIIHGPLFGHFVGHSGLSVGLSVGLSAGLSFGLSVGLSAGLSFGLSFGLFVGSFADSSSFFLLNVLENQGNPTTNRFFQASIAFVHGVPGIVLVISITALVNLAHAS